MSASKTEMNFFTLITAFAVLYIKFYQNGKLLSSGILSLKNEKRQETFGALPLFSSFYISRCIAFGNVHRLIVAVGECYLRDIAAERGVTLSLSECEQLV